MKFQCPRLALPARPVVQRRCKSTFARRCAYQHIRTLQALKNFVECRQGCVSVRFDGELPVEQKRIRALLSSALEPGKISDLRNQRRVLMKEIHRRTRKAAFDRIDAIAKQVEEASESTRMFAAVRALKKVEFQPVIVHDEYGHQIAQNRDKAQEIANFFALQLTDPLIVAPMSPFEGAPRPLNVPFSTGEICDVLRLQRNGRATGPDGVEMELYKFGGTCVATRIAAVFNQMFASHTDLALIHNGIMVPLPKPLKPKGLCSSLRPLSLLTALRKVFSSLIVKRCRDKMFGSIGPYQAAYRKGRSTTDILWARRWLGAISLHFHITIHGILIDVRAAFDSVKRPKLMSVAEQDPIFSEDDRRCIRLLLADNHFKVRCGNELSDNNIANLGSAQGDGASPCLFVYYLDKALMQAQSLLPEALATPAMDVMLELPQLMAYADDVSRFSTSAVFLEDRLRHDAVVLDAQWGLTVNDAKTERVHMHSDPPHVKCEFPCAICRKSCASGTMQCDKCQSWVHFECTGLAIDAIQQLQDDVNSVYTCLRCAHPEMYDPNKWKQCKALGSLLGDEEDLDRRLQLASGAFRQHLKLWGSRAIIRLSTRIRMYKSLVLPVILYNIGAMGLTEAMEQKLDVFHRRQLRSVLGVFWPDKISNVMLYKKMQSKPLSVVARERRWNLFRQMCILPPETPARRAMRSYFLAVERLPRPVGRPRNCIVTTLQRDLRGAKVSAAIHLENAEGLSHLIALAHDDMRWRRLFADVVVS